MIIDNPRTWLEVNKKEFEKNIKNISEAKLAKIALVIKSNAYGHGILEISKISQNLPEIEYLCVTSSSEADLLLRKNIRKKILILSFIDTDLDQLLDERIEIAAYNIDSIKKIVEFAKKFSKKIKIHIKIDSGMHRYGVQLDQLHDFIQKLKSFNNLEIVGVFTHLADPFNNEYSAFQIKNFNTAIDILKSYNINPYFKHIFASGSIQYDLPDSNLVRIGGIAYGLYKSEKHKKILDAKFNLKINPILTWKTRVSEIKNIVAESYVGYNRTYQAAQDSKIAVLPVGYYDGYDRQLSNKSHVLINNQLAPIIGIVSMNMVTVDITNLQNIKVNDEVTLLGSEQGLQPLDFSSILDTIPNEIVTKINENLPRKIV